MKLEAKKSLYVITVCILATQTSFNWFYIIIQKKWTTNTEHFFHLWCSRVILY